MIKSHFYRLLIIICAIKLFGAHDGFSYDRIAAQQYAQTYWDTCQRHNSSTEEYILYQGQDYNRAYNFYKLIDNGNGTYSGGDCTNFISQRK